MSTLGARGLNLGDGGRFMVATLGGGTGSVITGGKFANGAATAALVFVANDLATDRASAQEEVGRGTLDYNGQTQRNPNVRGNLDDLRNGLDT